jgi:hypothetical protein
MELDLLASSSLGSARLRAVTAESLTLDDGRCADRVGGLDDLRPGDEVIVATLPGRLRPIVMARVGTRRASVLPAEVVIAAGASLALSCGAAGITLRGDGRVLIDGLDIASRARRLNRITGGSVAIN